MKNQVNAENLNFGLSILHCWIRFFECLFHTAYRLPIKMWQARTNSEKKIVAETKQEIQKKFRKSIGLIVDEPKPGFGNTIDRNTARRFFQNAEKSAEITKIDLNLIKKMFPILIVVSSGHQIHIENFKTFAHNTAKLFAKKLPVVLYATDFTQIFYTRTWNYF